jgi:hypothetical protein
MRKLISFTAYVLIIALIAGCEGPQGVEGPKGKDGNANVSSAIYDIQPNTWKGDSNGYVTTLIVPEIDQKIYESGAVLVYMLNDEQKDYKNFNKLPYTLIDNNISEYMDYNVYIGSIDISIKLVDNGKNKTVSPSQQISYKVLIIEGTPLSVLKNNVDISNYNKVVAFMNTRQMLE